MVVNYRVGHGTKDGAIEKEEQATKNEII